MVKDASTSPTYRMAHWVSTVSRQQTLSARVEAVTGLKDLVGCMVGGAKEAVPQQVAKVAIGLSRGGLCTLVGHSDTVSAPDAAFANGAAAHILDFDDSFRPLTGHPSCTIVPAILAVAEEHHRSGDDLLDAYVVGVEVSASLGRATPKHHDVGWHGTATVGVISTAAACARLLGLDTDGCAAAISVAYSFSSGTRIQIGYDAKCVQAGKAARDGVTAAYLAAAGVSGCPEVLTGRWGWSQFYSAMSDDEDGKRYTFPPVEGPLAIVDPGITYKPYPTCGSTHRTLDAILDLCKKYDIGADQVQSVETTVPFLNVANLRYPRPSNGMQAKFSMPYTCSLAVLFRQICIQDFTDEAIRRPQVQEFMPKILVHTLQGSEHSEKTFLELPCYTKITLRSGESFDDTRYDRRGEASCPLTAEEEAVKFADCTHAICSVERREAILMTLSKLPQLSDVGALMRILAW